MKKKYLILLFLPLFSYSQEYVDLFKIGYAQTFNNNFEGAGYVYNEIGKIIHTKDNMIIETQLGSSRVSNMLENLIDRFIG